MPRDVRFEECGLLVAAMTHIALQEQLNGKAVDGMAHVSDH